MTEFIWYWTTGEKKIYTRNTDIAEKALKQGMLVMAKMINPNII